ncbi:unnamed protein product [Mycena citricolor]|uniref:Angiogenic factor with G patch and FHA domains 1 n=1 Tax=Mycena citricolor TaxID=2018698 RepID=A0AAD2JY89_9AGAR|nr:unnamed protein product [Mycena citricolor]
MVLESGEIPENGPSAPADYDASLEWPADESASGSLSTPAETVATKPDYPVFRLIVSRTAVLPRKQSLVISDGYNELQFGRDVAPSQDTPRVRLKEMEVSKLHATAYMDNHAWHLVDMGSKHGTFLQSSSAASAARLSPPRVASVPRRLHHLDTISIGSTTFIVHLHAGSRPCDLCCSCNNEVALFQTVRPRTATEPSISTRTVDFGSSRDPRKALSQLKQRLLASGRAVSSSEATTDYTDRSAIRRSMHTSFRHDAPGVLSAPLSQPDFRNAPSNVTTVSDESWQPPPLTTASQPPIPLPSHNIGHRLLVAQGWAPGSVLGIPEDGDGERIRLNAPLEVSVSAHRAGIGMPQQTDSSRIDSRSVSWREEGPQRRWKQSNVLMS